MPRLTFSSDFGAQTSPVTAVFCFAGRTYDLDDAVAAQAMAAGAAVAVLDPVAAPAAAPAPDAAPTAPPAAPAQEAPLGNG